MEYTLEKYDFRNYLLETLRDTRQDELIFWKKTIPMPVDLIYKIFEKRGLLLKKYIDHIGAACIFGYAMKHEGKNWREELANQPTEKNIRNALQLAQIIKKYMATSKIMDMLKELANALLLNDYFSDEVTLTESLCHEGRKYKRLYIPEQLELIVRRYFEDVMECIAISNNDMFSNVVADELKIYRMGFADAFSGIFNKLIDFILDNSTGIKKSYSSASAYTVVDEEPDTVEDEPVVYGKIKDGSIWEPIYRNSSTSCIVNINHPYYDWVKSRGPEAEEVFISMITEMARLENEIINNQDRNVIERYRQDISRSLRLRTETAIAKSDK